MINRFQSFLTEKFKGLPYTKDVIDFKEELLGFLMEKAEDLKGKEGMNQDEIFNECVESIVGYEQTLKELKGKPQIVREAKKAAKSFIYILMYFALVIGVYLAVSFVTEAWSLSWLIIAEGAFLLLIYLLLDVAIKAFSKNKIILARAVTVPINAVIFIGVYLAASMLLGIWGTSWIVFLFLPVFMLSSDLIVASLGKKNKILIPEIIALIMFLSIVIYISLSVLGVIAWHPYWVIVPGGAFLSLGILALHLKKK